MTTFILNDNMTADLNKTRTAIMIKNYHLLSLIAFKNH